VKECETIEFKKSLSELKEGLISLVAILNKHGSGELWFGVRNDGVTAGLDISAKTVRDVSQAISAHIEPKIFPHVTMEHRDDKECIKVVQQGRSLLTLPMAGHICASPTRIDNSAPGNWRTSFFQKTPNGFGGITRHLPRYWATWIRPESNGLSHARDSPGIHIIKNIHIGMRVKGLYREDVPEISIEAIREAIINAFCHRDYRDPDYVQIAVFKDRVEIRSPGGLFGGLTIAKIRKGNVSRRRNPLIADLFRRIRMVEAWGRGMPLILKNEPNAKFRELSGVFIASFDRPSFLKNSAKETIGKTIGKTIDKTLSTAEKTIMEAVAQNPSVTQKKWRQN
jgi:predicted HTH transcriptional regulator